MALELMALVVVSVLALILAWKFRQVQQELEYQQRVARRFRLKNRSLESEFQELESQLENPLLESEYLAQLQLWFQDSVQRSQLEIQQQEAQQQVQCRCSNQGLHPQDCS
jgi:predicted Holliday junction resolvase-like endonuclease